ncbi:calcium-binding protein, partial [Ramlibacter sp. AN1133]|uniref:calcium-binding protein n=1 Tax=Ramlibacter sp. AN1133 TaxID=3133429 RepID=UPI0030C15C70
MASYSGTSGSDRIEGTAQDEFMTGGAGDDTLIGAAGNDVLVGETGNDVLDGGAGDDTAWYQGTSQDYQVTWNSTTGQYRIVDAVSGRDGTDLFTGVEYLQFSNGLFKVADLVQGIGGIVVTGTAGGDVLAGTPADDQLRGLAGDDTLLADRGNDLLDGGAGNDTAVFSGAFRDYLIAWDPAARQYRFVDAVALRDGVDRVAGVESFQFADGMRGIADLVSGAGDGWLLAGTAASDTLLGGAGYDTLQGGIGNDVLTGGGSNDLIDGGSGSDTVRFSGVWADYRITWNASAAQFTVADLRSGRDGMDTVSGVEQFAFADGVRTPATLLTNGVTTRTGTVASETLSGSSTADSMRGLEGNDVLDGRAGNDTLEGGAGDDKLVGGAGNDWIDGGSGFGDRAVFNGPRASYTVQWDAAVGQYTVTDSFASRDGIDRVKGVEFFEFAGAQYAATDLVSDVGDGTLLAGYAGADYLVGGTGYDTLQGLDGNDQLVGNAGGDQLEGGAGDDYLSGGAGADRLIGGSGRDTARFSGASWEYDIRWEEAARQYVIADRMQGRDGTDFVGGIEYFAFADGTRSIGELLPHSGDGLVVTGTSGSDSLVGDVGFDSVQGLQGNDYLGGGGADDTLDGGDGDDLLRGDQGDDRIDGGAGTDRVQFSGWFWDYDVSWNAATREYTVADRYFGRDGTDTVRGVEFFDFYDGTRTIADLVPGMGDGETLVGTPGDDQLFGGSGYDLVQGLEGNDFL